MQNGVFKGKGACQKVVLIGHMWGGIPILMLLKPPRYRDGGESSQGPKAKVSSRSRT